MSEAIIAAAATLLVCLINNHYQQKRFEDQQHEVTEETNRKHAETVEMISYKLEQLTKKVELHNNAVERLHQLEIWKGTYEEKVRVANHRIEDLEKGRN